MNLDATTLNKKPRIWELDFLRGLSIILVAFDHAMITINLWFNDLYLASENGLLTFLANIAELYTSSNLRKFFWPIFVFIFFFVAGACIVNSKNNIKRGAKLFGVAAFITWITYCAEVLLSFEGAIIIFGVLHCLSVCILITALLLLAMKPIKNKKIVGIIFIVLGLIVQIYCVSNKMGLYHISYDTYLNNPFIESENLFLGFIFYTKAFFKYSADLFPLFPYIGSFFIGTGVASLVYTKKESIIPKLNLPLFRPIIFCGQKSLWIYLGIQGVALIIFGGLAFLITGSLM